jgi:hypothetical protein
MIAYNAIGWGVSRGIMDRERERARETNAIQLL